VKILRKIRSDMTKVKAVVAITIRRFWVLHFWRCMQARGVYGCPPNVQSVQTVQSVKLEQCG